MIPQGQQSSENATHERKDADVVGLLMVAGLLLLGLAISFLICWAILHLFNQQREAQRPRPRAPMAAEAKAFPQPRLLARPQIELEKIKKTARTELDSYGWVDRSAGIARIPLTRAMQLLVERGLPEVGAGQTRLQLMQARAASGLQPNDPITSPTAGATP